MNNYKTQEAFNLIRELGALVATPNIKPETTERANKMIESLIVKIVEPAVQEFTATSAGLIV